MRRRDMAGEPVLGPRRRWKWERCDDSYLNDITPDELLVEAKRLYAIAQDYALGDESSAPDDDEAAQEFARILEPVWEHQPPHRGLFGFNVEPTP